MSCSLRRIPAFLLAAIPPALMLVCLYPLLDRAAARREAAGLLERARSAAASPQQRRLAVSDEWLLRVGEGESGLRSWGNVGGCGVSGAASAAGGVKWVGRGASGGLVDVQCILSQSGFPDGAGQTTFNTRLGTALGNKWLIAATIPFRYNAEDVAIWDITKPAQLAGFGDVSLEVTRKLGIANAHTLTLSLSLPSGSQDAVRQGVVLPQRMQLGTGVPGAGLVYEYTRDFDWGLMIFGGNLFYGGWENSIPEFPGQGDFRGSGAGGYVYAGYLLGPLVPSFGLNLTTKITGDRERGRLLPDQPMVLFGPTAALEWSIDWLALLLSFSAQFSLLEGSRPLFGGAGDWKGSLEFENWTVGLGVQTSLF